MNDREQWRTEAENAIGRKTSGEASPAFALKGPKVAGKSGNFGKGVCRFAAFIERTVRRTPEITALLISLAVHLAAFVLLSFFAADYFGNPFGNGIEASAGDMSIRIDYTGAKSFQAKAPGAAPIAAKPPAAKRNGYQRLSRTARFLPRAVAAGPARVASAAEKPAASIDPLEAIPSKMASAKKTLDIPPEISKELGKKLRTAKFEEPAAQTSENAIAKVAGPTPDEGDIAVTETGVKYIDEDGAADAPGLIGVGDAKATAAYEGAEAPAGAGNEAGGGNSGGMGISGGGNGGTGEKKGGLGPRGVPGGTRRSGLVFEMVENSGYNETPSFLNGPPEIAYPKWAQEQGVEGCVKVVLDILPSGEVGSVSKVESPISDRLAQELVRQAEMWRFKPVYRNGRALSGSVIVTVDFSLAEKTALK